jgi:hypothetical protein
MKHTPLKLKSWPKRQRTRIKPMSKKRIAENVIRGEVLADCLMRCLNLYFLYKNHLVLTTMTLFNRKQSRRKPQKPRKKNPLFDAIAEVTHFHPEVSSAWIAKASKSLDVVLATPEDVRDMAKWYKSQERFRGFMLQPETIVKWWGQFIASRTQGSHGGRKQRPGDGRSANGTDREVRIVKCGPEANTSPVVIEPDHPLFKRRP